MIDAIIGALIILIVALAMAYIINSKKKGNKCIGCPNGKDCQNKCTNCSYDKKD